MKKNIIIKVLLIIFIFSATTKISAQTDPIDSLRKALINAKHDTTRCSILNKLAETASDEEWPQFNEQLFNLCKEKINTESSAQLKLIYLKHYALALNNKGFLIQLKGDLKKAKEYFFDCVKICKETKDSSCMLVVLNSISSMLNLEGDIDGAIRYSQESLKISEAKKDKNGIANACGNIGANYEDRGLIVKALEYYIRALKLYEEINGKYGLATVCNNIGTAYNRQGEFEKAIEYFNRALKIRQEIGDNHGIAISLNSIGSIYKGQNDLPKSLFYYQKGLGINEESGNKIGQAFSLYNIGDIYMCQGKNELAIEYFNKSYSIYNEINHKQGKAMALSIMGSAYIRQKKYSTALDYSSKALILQKELGYPESIKGTAKNLFDIYKETHNYELALKNYILYVAMRDSVTNRETKKASIRSQFQYQYEKKAAQDSIKNEEEIKVKNAQLSVQQAELKGERTQRFALYGGLSLILVFAGFVFNRFKVSQKQNKIISQQKLEVENQKHLIEEKQNEIIDSITYAKRIQEAILPPMQLVNEYLPNNFIFYKPKDIIAGDFYWMENVNDIIYIAAADSTGHGVPGAMVSVVCSNALNRAIKEFEITDTGKILDKTRELVVETFNKSAGEVKDGMDISLMAINRGGNCISWSGANNSLLYIENNELLEIKADKQPIGISDNPNPFKTHEIEIKQNQTFYLITDGYPDQFGGPKGKKFKYKQLEELLLKSNSLNLTEQYSILSNAFESWKGNLEQVDDVTIIGLRF